MKGDVGMSSHEKEEDAQVATTQTHSFLHLCRHFGSQDVFSLP